MCACMFGLRFPQSNQLEPRLQSLSISNSPKILLNDRLTISHNANYYIIINNLPEIDTWFTLIRISLIDLTNSTFRKENPNKRWIISFWPIFYWKCQWICIMFWWIREFQITMHWNLQNKSCDKFTF